MDVLESRARTTYCLLIAAASLSLALPLRGAYASVAQKIFGSPAAAAAALADAARNDDSAAALQILGDGAKKVIFSGDKVADRNAAQNFAADYQQMHRLAFDSDGRVILYIGARNWPFPIPIVKQGDGWRFDTAAGEKEILYRRIGANELFTIATLRELADAENEYRVANQQFARRILSDPGTRDGLYWPVSGTEPPSPIGPLVARASAEGYTGSAGHPTPFHGYFYRIITSQGGNAPGGARDYVVNGKLTGGFAILAYPAEYRSSGVMTFVVNENGDVLQKDLGAGTERLAPAMNAYNPDKSWTVVPEYSSETP
jgi:hypothetical protein